MRNAIVVNDPIDYPGWDGFLGTRASLMLDVVMVAMFVVVPVLLWSVYQVRYRRRYQLHKATQIVLTALLFGAVIAFEVEVRVFGWQERAAGQLGGSPMGLVWPVLWVHLCFAVTTFVLWAVVFVMALRRFPVPPQPSEHSPFHLFWARLAALDMCLTAVTGTLFYWVAFVR